MHSDAVAGRATEDRSRGAADRRAHHAMDWAVRLAMLAATLCPALASLGGSIVATLLVAIGWWAERHCAGRRTDGALL